MQKALFPGYTVGPDAYEDIVNICPAYGKRARHHRRQARPGRRRG